MTNDKFTAYICKNARNTYRNIKSVESGGKRYTMKNNGYVWDTFSRKWTPFYKILFDMD
ncbi:hypothetical protein [Pseudolactococcus insecticola]|uniref:Uncharacterized protein n=1 Tax=Pseudolactococcus insecticola TaxID=2709158 RepID=A0A6A0B6A7_9LACT|nr:hypothetical protein [Lactococcus insecticola]GFH39834.1 hypothetical protein Hs20B_02320 [Lactococcus insecticola]